MNAVSEKCCRVTLRHTPKHSIAPIIVLQNSQLLHWILRASFNTTGYQTEDRGIGHLPLKTQEVQSKCNIKKQSYATHIQVFQFAGFGFVNKSLLDVFLYQEPSNET